MIHKNAIFRFLAHLWENLQFVYNIIHTFCYFRRKKRQKTSLYNLFLFCRYEYDDHYFLTDPKEFIYEFFPLQSEWQLLRNPITLAEFEELPFVRSLFFRYQLSFPSDNMKSVMHTDSTGKHTGSHLGQNARALEIIFVKKFREIDFTEKPPFCHNVWNQFLSSVVLERMSDNLWHLDLTFPLSYLTSIMYLQWMYISPCFSDKFQSF